jgi:hypothetical protein
LGGRERKREGVGMIRSGAFKRARAKWECACGLGQLALHSAAEGGRCVDGVLNKAERRREESWKAGYRKSRILWAHVSRCRPAVTADRNGKRSKG